MGQYELATLMRLRDSVRRRRERLDSLASRVISLVESGGDFEAGLIPASIEETRAGGTITKTLMIDRRPVNDW